jgi:hypothetical protein
MEILMTCIADVLMASDSRPDSSEAAPVLAQASEGTLELQL